MSDKPPIPARIGHAIGSFFRGVNLGASTPIGQWEGHERNRLRARPVARLESQDNALDLGTRERMTAEARSLCQTFPVAGRILDKFATYTVGDCRYKWTTGNPETDKAYRDYWYDWMDRADATGRHRLPMLMRMAVKGMKRDGDTFVTFVPAGKRDIQIRVIEGDRIGNYSGGMWNVDDEKLRIIGGVIHDAAGRPTAYRANKRGQYGNFIFDRDIPAQQVRHLFEPSRADAARGITAFHAVLNTMRDMKETIDAEKSSIKQHSKISLLVKSIMGGASSGLSGLTLGDNNDTSDHSAKTNVEEIGDGMTKYMFPSEDVKAFQTTRPDAGWMNFQNLMLEMIAVGLNLPVSVVMKMSGTGPAVRHDMGDAQRTFDLSMDTLEEKLIDPIVGRVIANGIERGLLPPSPRWHMFERQRPPSITIDMGRESKANIDANDAWMRTGEDITNEDGQNHDDVVRKIAVERRTRYLAAKAEADAHGVPIEYILGTMTAKPAQPAEPEKTDEPSPAKP